MKILITGGAGFIGSAVVQAAVSKGNFDRFHCFSPSFWVGLVSRPPAARVAAGKVRSG